MVTLICRKNQDSLKAKNQLSKDDFTDTANLYSGSAGGVSISALKSETNIGTETKPFAAVITIGSGTELIACGNYANPGTLDISALIDIYAVDSVRVEGASGFGISLADSEINAYSWKTSLAWTDQYQSP